MRFALKLSYDGTHFSGWQKQKNARTVQGVLEEAALEIFGVPVKITGSGRTDAGVHALQQVCHFDAQTEIPAHKLRECFNRILPPDVCVLESVAKEGFDCTCGGKRKTYVYRAYAAPCMLPLSERYEARLPEVPDINKMRAAAKLFVGEHDFAAFRATGSSAKTSVRTLYRVEVEEKKEQDGARHYQVTVCGNGFLYNMVRILAGELFAIGLGKDPSFLTKALQTGERSLLAKTMPAKGLTLIETAYETPIFGVIEE